MSIKRVMQVCQLY